MMERVNAVILAGGGTLRREGAPEQGEPEKALLSIGNRCMVDYVVEALRRSPGVDRLVLVGPPALRERFPDLLYAAPGDSPLGSLSSGVAVLDALPDRGGTEWVLACTGDIPLLTPEAVADFLDRCQGREADFYYPIIPRETAEAGFPGVRRTYARLREGSFTGGNLFLIRRGIMERCLPRAEEFVRLRKKPVALAGLVGFGILLKFLLGRLRVQDAERRISHLFGIRGAAVITPFPEVGVDVDKPSDLELARERLAAAGR